MMLPRPYIPLSVRIAVITRQLDVGVNPALRSQREYLGAMLKQFFGDEKFHLDHDPPLVLRQKLYDRGRHVAYSPPANDPDHLVYRTTPDHKKKTFVSGDGAQRSDMGQRRYLKKVEKNRQRMKRELAIGYVITRKAIDDASYAGKKWPKRKIPQRKNPWPKRKFRS